MTRVVRRGGITRAGNERTVRGAVVRSAPYEAPLEWGVKLRAGRRAAKGPGTLAGSTSREVYELNRLADRLAEVRAGETWLVPGTAEERAAAQERAAKNEARRRAPIEALAEAWGARLRPARKD